MYESLLTGNPVTLHACNIIQTLEKDTRWETRVRLKSHIAVPALKWEIQKMRRDQIQFTPNTTRMKTINFPIFFFHAVSNCWRMKLKITIKYFFTALQANVNQNHLFFWFRNFICRHSARLVGPKQNYVNWEKMQTNNHAPSRIQPANTSIWAAEDRTRLRSYSHYDCCYHRNLDKTDKDK